MRLALFLCALVSLMTGCGQTVGPKSLTILELGLPPKNDYRNARSIVADKWGFDFKSVAGCVVTDHLIDSVKAHNTFVEARLDSLFGADWEERFDLEVEKELVIERNVRGLIDIQPYIKSRDALMRSKGNGLYYILDSPDTSGAYPADVIGWNSGDGPAVLMRFYILKVDPWAGTVVVVDDKPEPLE